MAGYYRGSYANDSLSPVHSYFSPVEMTYSLLILVIACVALRRKDYGIGIIISWILTNLLAGLFGQYQQERVVFFVWADTVSTAWRQLWQGLVKR